MLLYDPQEMSQTELYKLLVGCVMPRPIAWISTVSGDGRPNLAPFSFFNVASRSPATLAISIGPPADPGKGKKDTLKNAEETKELVVHVVSERFMEEMNISGAEFPNGINEFDIAGLTAVPSAKVKPPRIAGAEISMECILKNVIPVGSDHLLLAEVVAFNVNEDVVENGKIQADRLHAVGRMAGPRYCKTGDTFGMNIPPVELFLEKGKHEHSGKARGEI